MHEPRACGVCGATRCRWRLTWCKSVDLSGFPLEPVEVRFACRPVCLGVLIDQHEGVPLSIRRCDPDEVREVCIDPDNRPDEPPGLHCCRCKRRILRTQ